MTKEEAIQIVERVIHTESKWPGTEDTVEALDMAIAALRAQTEAERNGPLKTTWDTPEICPHCMEHLSKDWSFCPECGRPTDWSENAALTLEELRKLDGEPVWVEIPKQRVAEWCIATQDVLCGRPKLWSAGGGWFDSRNCGKSLFAYRRKPKEAPAERIDQ